MEGIRKFFVCSALVAGALLGKPSAEAVSILYWTDHAVGEDAMAGALGSIGDHGDYEVTFATGDEDFATRIATGDYQLGILFVQLDASGYDSTSALASFAEDDGWAIYSDFSGDNSRAELFDFQYTGEVNQDVVSILDPSLESPVEVADPVSLSNPGWLDYSFGIALSGEGSVLARFGNGDAAVVRTFPGGRVMGLGLLNDSFADSAEGEAFFTNAIVAIPEPSTVGGYLGAIALVAAVSVRRFRSVVHR